MNEKMNDKYIGKLLDNRYEILQVIGTGGMAVVYKALCHRLNRYVAVKILKDEFAKDEEFRTRFREESHAVAMLSHPNIVSVYDVSRSNSIEYIVMELMDGMTLKQYMDRRGTLSQKESVHFAAQILKALSHAHSKGIIHRDIKPHNIMLLRDSTVKVADFGIARLESSQKTITREAFGSVHYIAPEQAKGSNIDCRADIYSTGVVLYEMLTGRLPYEGDTPVSIAIQHINSMPLSPREINPEIPEALEKITMKAMSSNLAKRYASTDEMLADLEKFRKNPNVNIAYVPSETVKAEVTDETRKIQISDTSDDSFDEEQESANPLKAKIPLVAGIIAIIVFVAGLLMLFPGLRGIFTGEDEKENVIKAPDILGMTVEEVNRRYEGFDIVINENRTSNEYEVGEIIEQKPGVGEDIKNGKIIVVVSLGSKAEEVMLIDLEGKTKSEAIDYLIENGLENYDISEKFSKIDEGCVIGTEPKAGEVVTSGTKIILNISKGRSEEDEIEVPDVLGMSFNSATEKLVDAGIPWDMIKEHKEYSEKYEKGKVIRIEPKAGSTVYSDYVIDVYVSSGADTVIVPDLTGKSEAEAKKILENAGITSVGVESVNSDTVKVGEVVKTKPAKGREIAVGEKVIIYISEGKETLKVPNVTGKSENDAVKKLKDSGITDVKIEKVNSDSVGKGKVVETKPAAGSEIEKGTSVTLYISEGTGKLKVPDVSGKSENDAVKKLKDSGITEVRIERINSDSVETDRVIETKPEAGTEVEKDTSVTVYISAGSVDEPEPSTGSESDQIEITKEFRLPTDKESFSVKITVNSEVQYEGTHTAEDASVSVTLKGKGPALVRMYVDDMLQVETTMDFE